MNRVAIIEILPNISHKCTKTDLKKWFLLNGIFFMNGGSVFLKIILKKLNLCPRFCLGFGRTTTGTTFVASRTRTGCRQLPSQTLLSLRYNIKQCHHYHLSVNLVLRPSLIILLQHPSYNIHHWKGTYVHVNLQISD